MCNRFQLRASNRELKHAFGAMREHFQPQNPLDAYRPAEFFPGSIVPVINCVDGHRQLTGATWGIQLGKHHVVNSRDDKLNVWGRFFKRRCVMPLHHAVEWRYPLDMFGQPTGKPTPWTLYPADESIAAVAAIADADDAGDLNVSMMTTRATGLAAEVHNKQPDEPRIVVFLTEPSDIETWLDRDADRDAVEALLGPPPAGWLAGEPITK